MIRITVTLDEVDPEAIIKQVVRIQHDLATPGYEIDIRVPQKGYDAVLEWGKTHKGPVTPPSPLGPMPKWVTCLSGIPLSPIEDSESRAADEHISVSFFVAAEKALRKLYGGITLDTETVNRAVQALGRLEREYRELAEKQKK